MKKLSPLTLFPGYSPIQLAEQQLWRATRQFLPPLSDDGRALVQAADRIGRRAQYRVDGFMPNKRQVAPAGGTGGAAP